MNISSAYLFGRTLKPGGAPPLADNIYFENGQFNPLYVPQGFNFNTNQHSFETNIPSDLYYVDYPEGYLEDSSVIFMWYKNWGTIPPNEHFEIGQDGCIHLVHNSVAGQYNSYVQNILLPIGDISEALQSYSRLCFDFSYNGQICMTYWYALRKDTSTTLSSSDFWEDYSDYPEGEYTGEIYFDGAMDENPEFIAFQIFIGDTEGDSNDFDFKISRIYFTNG